MTIWKFPIPITDSIRISAPFGAEVIHVGLDGDGVACVWCEVTPGNSPSPLDLRLVGTGHPIPSGVKEHLGSFTQGPFVWHLYRWVA